MLYVAAAQSSSHYPGGTAIRIDSYPVVGVFLTQTQAYRAKAALGHLWYNSGTKFTGPSSAALSGSPLCQDVNLPSDLRQWLPAHPYYHHSAHFHFLASSLSWATRLHGRNELSNLLSDRHAFNMAWGRTTNWSLTDIDGDRYSPKPPCLVLLYQNLARSPFYSSTHGYFHDSKYSQPCFGIHLYLAGDRKSPNFYRSKHD